MRTFTMSQVTRAGSWLLNGAHTGLIGTQEESNIFVEIHGVFPRYLGEQHLTFTEIDPTAELAGVLLPHSHSLDGASGELICNI